MSEWIKVAKEKDLPLGERKVVRVKGRRILLINLDGQVYALDNRCAHAGAPLSRGHLEGHLLICPWHDWAYDVRTGQLDRNSKLNVRSYPTRTEKGRIYVGWSEETA